MSIMVRILIADDDVTVRTRLRRLLEKKRDWQVCGEAASGPQAIELALRLSPHVAVLDLAMPEINGLEATRQIRKALPDTEVLIFATHEADDLTRDLSQRRRSRLSPQIRRRREDHSGRRCPLSAQAIFDMEGDAGGTRRVPQAWQRRNSAVPHIDRSRAGSTSTPGRRARQHGDFRAAFDQRQDGRDPSCGNHEKARHQLPGGAGAICDSQ